MPSRSSHRSGQWKDSAILDTAFVGVGHSRLFRKADVPLGVLAAEACRAAIADAGLAVGQVDGIACVPEQHLTVERQTYDGVDFVTCQSVIRSLGLKPRWGENLNGMVGRSVVAALAAVQAGLCDYAVVFRAMHNPSGVYGLTANEIASGDQQFEMPYGVFPPGQFAQMWHRYQDVYKSGSREQMATFVIQARANGLLWEHGYWAQYSPKPLDLNQYLGSRPVSTPLSMLDCDIPVQGCGALVVTTAERAADLPHRPAYVHGVAATTFSRLDGVLPFTLEYEMACGRALAANLWRDAGVEAKDVSLANLYDGFSIITPLWLEAMGFCGDGEAFDFMQQGRIAIDGELPLNPSGGNLGAGRLHGVNHIVDSVLQVMGRSGPRQIADVELALTTIGPLSRSTALLLGPTRPSRRQEG